MCLSPATRRCRAAVGPARAVAPAVLLMLVLWTTACAKSDPPTSAGTTTTTQAVETTSTTGIPLDQGEQIYVYQPQIGDCWERRRTDEKSQQGSGHDIVLKLSCDKPHDNENFGLVEYTEREFPGDANLKTFAKQRCPQFFERYIGVAYELSQLEMGYYTPTQVVWNNTYKHVLSCYVRSADGTKLEGSMRDSKR